MLTYRSSSPPTRSEQRSQRRRRRRQRDRDSQQSQSETKSYNAEVRQELSRWLRDYKSQLSCTSCGFSHHAALDFHHIDPSTKNKAIGDFRGSVCTKEMILEEIAKCAVLCSNCHRIMHYYERLQKIDSFDNHKEG